MYAEAGLLFPYFQNFSQEVQQLEEYCKTQFLQNLIEKINMASFSKCFFFFFFLALDEFATVTFCSWQFWKFHSGKLTWLKYQEHVHLFLAQVGLHVFREMVFEVGIEPNGITMVGLLKPSANLGDLNIGRMVHGLVISRGFGFEVYMENSLIDMYSKLLGYLLALSMYALSNWSL